MTSAKMGGIVAAISVEWEWSGSQKILHREYGGKAEENRRKTDLKVDS